MYFQEIAGYYVIICIREG